MTLTRIATIVNQIMTVMVNVLCSILKVIALDSLTSKMYV